jgi:hypothetical protein
MSIIIITGTVIFDFCESIKVFSIAAYTYLDARGVMLTATTNQQV